jgi:hypothetical protein
MQSAACLSMHSVEERCSRWLLMTYDRVAGDGFQLTHEFPGYMLGTRRPTVSLVLGTLEKAGVIRNCAKRITIVNRQGLEEMSCECFKRSETPSADCCRIPEAIYHRVRSLAQSDVEHRRQTVSIDHGEAAGQKCSIGDQLVVQERDDSAGASHRREVTERRRLEAVDANQASTGLPPRATKSLRISPTAARPGPTLAFDAGRRRGPGALARAGPPLA